MKNSTDYNFKTGFKQTMLLKTQVISGFRTDNVTKILACLNRIIQNIKTFAYSKKASYYSLLLVIACLIKLPNAFLTINGVFGHWGVFPNLRASE